MDASGENSLLHAKDIDRKLSQLELFDQAFPGYQKSKRILEVEAFKRNYNFYRLLNTGTSFAQ